MKLSDMTLKEMKDYCFQLNTISTVFKFDDVFKKEGYVEIEYAPWRNDEASCLLMELKDGVVPFYFSGADKKFIHIREIAPNQLESVVAVLKSNQIDRKTLNAWLQEEDIKPWYSVIEFFYKIKMESESVYEDIVPNFESYAFSFPDEFGSGYVLFPLQEVTFICPFEYNKVGWGHIYNPNNLRVLGNRDRGLIQDILAYQLKTEKVITDLVYQKRLTALLS